jgi:hypothetical protein
MPYSQLDVYLEIIKSLRENGPQTPHQTAYLPDTNPASKEKLFDFLAKEKFIERLDEDTYAPTESGLNVLDFFKI